MFQAIRKTIIGNIAFNAVGKLLSASLAFVALKLISKELGMAQYGLWTQFLFAVKLLVPLVVMQLESALIRFFEHKTHPAKQHWFAMLVLIVGFNSILAGLFLAFPTSSANLVFGDISYHHFISYIIIFTGTESCFLFLISFFRAAHQTAKMTLFRAVQSLLQLVALIVLCDYFQQDIEHIIQVFIGINMGMNILLFTWIAFKNGLFTSFKVFKLRSLLVYLRYAFPLMLAGFAAWLIYASDRFFLAYFYQLETVGLYAAMSIFGSLAFMFQDAFNLLILPQCVRLWEKGKRQLAVDYAVTMSNVYIVLAGLGIVLVATLGPQLLILLSSTDFQSSPLWLALLTLSYALPGFDQRKVVLIYLEKNTKRLAFITLTVAAINIGLNFILIPVWGIKGAIASTLLSYLGRSIWLWNIGVNSRILIPNSIQLLIKIGLTVGCLSLLAAVMRAIKSLEHLAISAISLGLLYFAIVWLGKFMSWKRFRFVLREVSKWM